MAGEKGSRVSIETSDPIRAGRKALDIAQLCSLRPLPDPVIAEFDAPLVALLQVAEASIRARVALRLAGCSWAPREAVRMLAFEPLDISKPIIARSPLLTEADLLKLTRENEEHRLLIARRPRVSEAVGIAVARYRETRCLLALAQNEGAELSDYSAEDFADAARADGALQAALAGRSDMSQSIAEVIFAVAGETVKQSLTERFPDLAATLIDQAVDEATDKPEALASAAAKLAQVAAEKDFLTKADVLESALHRRLEITDQAVSTLTGIPVEDWQLALSRSPLRVCLLASRAMAMSCKEATRFYFALSDCGRCHRMDPDAFERACTEIYDKFARDDARHALHRLGASGSIS